ncbi:hypothetical protein DY252_20660 [Thalassospira indica]|uniref:Uncharacterized protein n=1 Tax=Thalassospira indica TaxID=1891279 RepID=A0ABM6Y365_9PROT|nr:hypothetical protein DY252_20660 [Thalassospira indica]
MLAHIIARYHHQIINPRRIGDGIQGSPGRDDKITGTCRGCSVNCADIPTDVGSVRQACSCAQRFQRTGQNQIGKSVKQDKDKSMMRAWHDQKSK